MDQQQYNAGAGGSNGSHFAAPESNHPNEAGGLPSVRKRDRDDEREEEDGDSQRPIKRREMNHQGQNGGANSDDDGEGSVDGDAEDYHHAGVGIGGAQGSALTEAKVERQAGTPFPASSSGSLAKESVKYCSTVLRSVQRIKDAHIFAKPVDPVALNIPTYFDVITRPMDLSTIEKKLKGNQYATIQQFKDDMQLMFDNCYKFNGRDSPVGLMGQNVEKAFHNCLLKTPRSADKDTKKKTPTIDKSESHAYDESEAGRPKREIHVPTKDLPTGAGGAFSRKGLGKKMDHGLKHCANILRELTKKQNTAINWPFLQPVGNEVPNYYTIIKSPMDLATIKRKLDDGEYLTASEFREDLRLMFRNCYTFNPPGTDVHELGKKLEALFEQKWAEMPPPRAHPPEQKTPKVKGKRKPDYGSDEDEDSEDDEETQHEIEKIEKEIAVLVAKLDLLKTRMLQKNKQKQKRKSGQFPHTPLAGSKVMSSAKPKPKLPKPPKAVGSASKTPKKPRKSIPGQKKRKVEYSSEEELPIPIPALTQTEKEELASSIEMIDEKLHEKMIEMLQGLKPNPGETEIVLDLESLDRKTAYMLYRFVKKHAKPRGSTSKKAKLPKSGKEKKAPSRGEQSSSSSDDSGSSSGSESSGSDDSQSASSRSGSASPKRPRTHITIKSDHGKGTGALKQESVAAGNNANVKDSSPKEHQRDDNSEKGLPTTSKKPVSRNNPVKAPLPSFKKAPTQDPALERILGLTSTPAKTAEDETERRRREQEEHEKRAKDAKSAKEKSDEERAAFRRQEEEDHALYEALRSNWHKERKAMLATQHNVDLQTSLDASEHFFSTMEKEISYLPRGRENLQAAREEFRVKFNLDFKDCGEEWMRKVYASGDLSGEVTEQNGVISAAHSTGDGDREKNGSAGEQQEGELSEEEGEMRE